MEPLEASIRQRLKNYKPFHEFVRGELTTKYLQHRLNEFGVDEHCKRIEQDRTGLFGIATDLFMRLHDELGPHFGLPDTVHGRSELMPELQTLYVSPGRAEELADELARTLVVLEKQYGAPFWKLHERGLSKVDLIKILKNKIREVHKRYGDTIIGPNNVV